jgi:hypothetical protein
LWFLFSGWGRGIIRHTGLNQKNYQLIFDDIPVYIDKMEQTYIYAYVGLYFGTSLLKD